MAAGQYDVTARIAVEEAGLVPRRGHGLQEVQFELGQFLKVVRLHGDALDGRLVDNGRCHLEDVGGIAAVTALVVAAQEAVHDGAAPVHRADGIAAEGVHRQFESLAAGVTLAEVDVLAGQYGLGSYVVGIHHLPAAGDGATVEDALYAVAVGVEEYVFVELHRRLLVAAEEVDLDALHAYRLHPRHLAVAGHGGRHTVAGRLRGVVLVAVRVVP